MKRVFFVALALLLFGTAIYGAMTYDQSYYRANRGYLGSATSNDPLYNLWGTLEGLYEGTTNFDAIRIIESTGATYWTKLQGGDQGGNITLTLPVNDGDNGQVLTTNGSGVLSWAAAAGTFTGGNITSDVTMADGVDILTSTTTAESTGIQGYTDGGARKDAFRVTNGATVAVVAGASDVSFALASTGVDISTAGAISNATTIGASGVVTAGGWSGTGNFAQGDGTGSFSVASTGVDISAAGAVSNVTSLTLTDNITMATGKGVLSSLTTAETVGVYGYDNNGSARVGALVITNGDTPATVLGNGNGTTAITSTDWAISTTGAMTGIGAITTDGTLTYSAAAMTVYTNEATTWTHGTDGAADDWTLALTGATDSSIIVSSAGTGADAISLAATAGTVKAAGDQLDLDATNDLNITVTSSAGGEDLLITQSGANDSSIVLTADGTGADAISLAAAAGTVKILGDLIDMDSTGDFNLTVTSNGDGEDLLISQVGAQDASVTVAAAGTGADAIGLQASAGGVDIDAAATKDVAIDGGQVLITSKDNAASAVAITTNQGGSETIVVTNTQGTDAGAITATATAGGVTLSAATANKGITLTGEVYVKKGGDIASPGGGELDLTNGVYFDITGTNNITSIAAADSTAGRMIILQFDAILTFTDGNNLKLAGNLVTSADDTITLICDGTNWHEVCRSVN